MSTSIRGRYIVGFDGRDHCLIENGEIVFEGDSIVHVGPSYAGPVARRIDAGNAVIGPGFIDLDALADLDSTVLCFDNYPHWAKGRIWPRDYLAAGTRDVYTADEEAFKMHYAFVQLLRNGITTAMPITSLLYRQWAETYEEFARVAEIAGHLGIRAYLGPAYRSGATVVDESGALDRHWDEARGLDGLERAIQYARDVDGRFDGLVRGMLAPDRIETCTPALLERTAAAAEALDCPVRLHCAQSLYEFETVVKLRGRTPIQYVRDSGLLNRRAALPHGIFLSDHSRIRHPVNEDVALLAASGATLVHCPLVMMRMGGAMESFARLSRAGINIAMGTDTYPPDMLENLRAGINLCRVVERRADACSAAELYRAATLGGAKALGRDDLGRLAPGAKADITVFDLDDTHTGQFWDPIQTMVVNGIRGQFKTVVVNGRIVIEDGRMPGQDFAALQARAQRQYDKLMQSYPERCPGRPPVEQIFTPSFPFVRDPIKPLKEAP